MTSHPRSQPGTARRGPITEIILTDENGEEQMLIGGKVSGRGPVTSEHVAYRGKFVVKDLRKSSALSSADQPYHPGEGVSLPSTHRSSEEK